MKVTTTKLRQTEVLFLLTASFEKDKISHIISVAFQHSLNLIFKNIIQTHIESHSTKQLA
jgi:hypothetical protein